MWILLFIVKQVDLYHWCLNSGDAFQRACFRLLNIMLFNVSMKDKALKKDYQNIDQIMG